MEQITTVLILLVESVALIVVLTWPAVKGKGWLVGALLAVLTSGVCALVLQMLMTQSGEMIMGVEECRHYLQFAYFLYGLELLGKILFVIAVIRLRTPLKQFVERV
ncbi:hypothetical protein [Gimesia sp.]|uniref:hypothetical protein n=1 Tax=Gimesia sp. TaxID=2024833 RepID=UPI003A938BA7